MEEMNNNQVMEATENTATAEPLTGEVVETSGRFGITAKEAEGLAIIGGCAILAFEGGKAIVKKIGKTKAGEKVKSGFKKVFKKKQPEETVPAPETPTEEEAK